jgi:pyruvate formate lyase activating enzyme
MATYVTPQEVVEKALEAQDDGVCGSFTEPTLLYEFDLELFKLAREANLYCCFVSNGYMSQKALEKLIEAGLSGLKVDVKGGSKAYEELGLKSEIPWRNIKLALEARVHVEVVALLVTNFSDSSASISEVVENHLNSAGPKVPLHFTRYFPAYRYQESSTSVERLELAYELAKKAGVEFVYIGNVPGHPALNTYCPNCYRPLIKRSNWQLLKVDLTKDGACPGCGRKIPLRGSVKKS